MANLGRLAIGLLGILAYQNRDKIGDAIRGMGQSADPDNPQRGLLDQLSKGVSGTALGDVLDRFRQSGSASKVDSWVRNGPNEPIGAQEVESAIDEETLASLSRQTGLSRDELVSRITRDLPEAIDALTPAGTFAAGSAPDRDNLLDDIPSRT